MPVFIITSGFFYRDSVSESVKSLSNHILRKIKQLWLPYFAGNTIFILLNNVFIRVNIYTNDPNVVQALASAQTTVHDYLPYTEMFRNIVYGGVFKGGAQIGGAMWFLAILFLVSVLYCVSDYMIKKIFHNHFMLMQGIWAAFLLIIGYLLGQRNITLFGMAKTFGSSCIPVGKN